MKQDILSANGYLRKGNARKLPIYKCWATANYQEFGIANVIVSRKHKNGNISAGFYLVDLYCLGIKDSIFFFNLFESDFMSKVIDSDDGLEEVSYEFAHNLVYGADAYCEEIGLTSHKSFKDTQLVLDEDTDAIELMYFEFGLNGKPHLVINHNENRNKELNILEKNFGEDGFTFIDNYYGLDDSEESEIYEKLKELNDDDAPYYYQLEDVDLIEELSATTNEEYETANEKISEILLKYSKESEVAVHMNMDSLYDTVFKEHHQKMDAITILLPVTSNKKESIYDYMSDYEDLDEDIEVLMDENDQDIEKVIELLNNRYPNDQNIYELLEECYFDDLEKLNIIFLKHYNNFPDSLFAKAKLLSHFYLSLEEPLTANELLEDLPFRIEPSLNFYETNPMGKDYHVGEIGAFLLLNGFAFAANNQVQEADKCLHQMAKLKIKGHEFFIALRSALTALKQKDIMSFLEINSEGEIH